MQDALVNVPQRFTALRTKLEGELDQLSRLTLVEEPYKVKMDEAGKLLEGMVNYTILVKARKSIQEAGENPAGIPIRIGQQQTGCSSKGMGEEVGRGLIKAWAAEDHALVGDLLELGKEEESFCGEGICTIDILANREEGIGNGDPQWAYPGSGTSS